MEFYSGKPIGQERVQRFYPCCMSNAPCPISHTSTINALFVEFYKTMPKIETFNQGNSDLGTFKLYTPYNQDWFLGKIVKFSYIG